MRLRSLAAGSFCAFTGAVLGGPKRFPRRLPLAVRTATSIHVPSRPSIRQRRLLERQAARCARLAEWSR